MDEKLFKIKEFNKDLEKKIDQDLMSNFINFLYENPNDLVKPINKNSIKKRIENNNLYLDNLYSFFDEEKDSINELIKLTEVFLKECSEDKFHKRKQFKEDFEVFFNENDIFNRTFPELGDCFLIKLLVKVFIKSIFEVATNTILIEYTSTSEDSNISEEVIDDTAEDNSNHPNLFLKEKKETLFNINNGYSRNHVTNEILKNLSNWEFILSIYTKIKLNLSNLENFVTNLLLFLESKNFLIVEHKSFNKRNIKYNIRYNFKNKKNSTQMFNSFFFDLQYNKQIPIILKPLNKYIPERFKYDYFAIPDILIKGEPLIRHNEHYEGFNSEDERKIKILQKRDNDLFEIFLKKELNTPIFWQKKKFEEIMRIFIKEHLDNMDLSINTSEDQIIKVFINYSSVKSAQSKELLKNLLILLHFIKFYKSFKGNEVIYFLFFLDFRGREYYKSIISPTNCTLTRLFIYYGYYSQEELKIIIEKTLSSKAFEIIKDYIPKIIENKDLLNNKFFDDTKEEKYLKYLKSLAINSLISLGVKEKTKILKNNEICEDGFSIKLEHLFLQGLEELNLYLKNKQKYLKSLSLEDRYLYLKDLDFLLKSNDICIKEIVPYDFSCSGHQIRYLFSGFKNKKNYVYINIAGKNLGTDLYSFFIKSFTNILLNSFKEEKYFSILKDFKNFYKENIDLKNFKEMYVLFENFYKVSKHFENAQTGDDSFETRLIFNRIIILFLFEKEEILRKDLFIFNRSVLKKSIMTVQYNVSFFNFKGYFEKEIKKSKFFDDYINKKQKYIFVLQFFYFFIKNINNFEEFKCNKLTSSAYIEIKENDFILRFFDNFKVPFAFFKQAKTDKRIIYYDNNKVRHTKSVILYEDNPDNNKTKRAFDPNFIHSIDASIVRLYNCYSESKNGIITIHDEYLIPYQESLIFKDKMNIILKLDFFDKPSFKDISNLSTRDHKVTKSYLLDEYSFLIIW